MGAGTAVLRPIEGSAWAPFGQNLSPGWNGGRRARAPPPTDSAGTAASVSPIEVNALTSGRLSQHCFFLFCFFPNTFILLLLRWPFSRGGEWGLLCCGAGASHCGAGALGRGLGSCGSSALEHRLIICDTAAELLHSLWDLPGSGMEPVPPALAGGLGLYH